MGWAADSVQMYAKNLIFCLKMVNLCKQICIFSKKSVPLHAFFYHHTAHEAKGSHTISIRSYNGIVVRAMGVGGMAFRLQRCR